MPYSTITDAEIDPDSPVTTGLMAKIRGNMEAIPLGESGATRVRLHAMSEPAVKYATSNGSPIVFQPFSSVVSSVTHIVSCHVTDNAEFPNASPSASVDNTLIFSAGNNTGVKFASASGACVTTNATHTFTFNANYATVVSIAS